jgi:protein-tyrosine-phosphatase
MTTTSTLIVPTRPRVLFVGHDASSPQIAASLLRRVAGDRIAVDTAGTQTADPSGRSDEMLVAMGLDPADEQRLSAGALYTADLVVILGAGLDVARLPGPRYEQWDLAEDDLADRVQALSDHLTIAPAAKPRPAAMRRLRTLLRAAWPRTA